MSSRLLTAFLVFCSANFCYASYSFLNTSQDYIDIRKLKMMTKTLQKPSVMDIVMAKIQHGQDADVPHLSVERPTTLKPTHQKPKQLTRTKRGPEEKLSEYFEDLPDVIQKMKFKLKKSKSDFRELGEKASNKIRQWLLELSSCSVKYRWTDLGASIFPRYILRGVCSRKQTCSFPPGMQCVESERDSVTVYLFTCAKKKRRCRWLPLNVEVLKKCKCKCVQ